LGRKPYIQKEDIMSDVYERLAKHLDNLPGGFPATDSGVELRILKRLFTPQEAEAAMGLSMMQQPALAIAKRLNMDASTTTQLLESMSKKGLIIKTSKGGEDKYMAAQFVVGIWEYQVNDLNEGLIKDFNEYSPHLMEEQVKQKTKQLRVIPVSQSISAGMHVMLYEEAENIIKGQSKIVVADCICRKEQKMVGKGCDRPMETCLIFSGGAYLYESRGIGRSITQEEALEILNQGVEAGLVLQPGNSQKPINICMCCGCCCQILKNLKIMDRPAKLVNTSYYAAVNEDECTACGTCEDRCQMDAITVDEVAHVNIDRCIGCGLCVMACEFEAIKLFGKDKEERWIPPQNVVAKYADIARERGKTIM
jgi:electron transport complex protein RnfB